MDFSFLSIFDSECSRKPWLKMKTRRRSWSLKRTLPWSYGTGLAFPQTTRRIQQLFCKACTDKFRTSDGNTTNLFHHLKRQHPKQYAESQTVRRPATLQPTEATGNARPKQTTLTLAFDKSTLYVKTSKPWKEVTEAVTFYLAKDKISIKIVENEGFKRLLRVVDPRYKLHCLKYFSSTVIPNLYSVCCEKIERKVQNVQVSATTSNLWSSRTSEP